MSLDVKKFAEELKAQLRGELTLNHLNMGMMDAVRFASFIAMLSPTRKVIEAYVRQQCHSVSEARLGGRGSEEDAPDDAALYGLG